MREREYDLMDGNLYRNEIVYTLSWRVCALILAVSLVLLVAAIPDLLWGMFGHLS